MALNIGVLQDSILMGTYISKLYWWYPQCHRTGRSCINNLCWLLRVSTEWLILAGFAMFGAIFNLVTRVGLPYYTIIFVTLNDWKSANQKFAIKQLLQVQKRLTKWRRHLSKMVFKNYVFGQKAPHFVHFGPYDLLQILSACSPHTYQILHGET